MRETARASLLGFAIAASAAVVPLLLVVLLGLGRVVPVVQGEDASNHISVRQIAALKTFEHAIVRRDRIGPAAPSVEVLASQLPECAREWGGRADAMDRVRGWLLGPADPSRTPASRVSANLAVLDEALLDMSGAGNRRVVDAVGFDVMRWAEAGRRALATPVEAPRYPGRRFSVRCADLASAAALISRARGRMLATLAWRGTEVERTTAQWRPEQYVAISARHLARTNPWEGVPGCVYLLRTDAADGDGVPAYFLNAARASSERVCNQPAMFSASGESTASTPEAIGGDTGANFAADDPRWQVPPSIHLLLQPLGSLQRTSGALYREYTQTESDAASRRDLRHRPNRVVVEGTPVDAGFSVDLTIDPALQALAQKTAACYTGRQDVCRALAIARAEDGKVAIGHRMLERAMVRMAAVAIIDVRSGRIEALAGALSPCTRQEYDGPGRAAGCDRRLPYPIRYRPDALRNPAVFLDAMPASVVKPVMAAAFLADARVGNRWLAAELVDMRRAAPPGGDSLRGQLMRSNSARFLDRMFCADGAFGPCERPWEVQAAATVLGWNADCGSPSELCGKHDLLFGRAPGTSARDLAREFPAVWIPYGRLLAEPVEATSSVAFRARAPLALDVAKIKRCALGADGRRASDDDWEKCRGGVVVDVVAEGWGQGHARSTALGAAGMMAALAAGANGQQGVRKPHLVRALRGTSGFSSTLDADVRQLHASAFAANGIPGETARVILDGLSYSHRYGTARRACEQVFDARTCREIDWIAGKTGTPTFPNDERSLDDLASLCVPGRGRTPAESVACGNLRPYKWYVAAYRSDPARAEWTKAIGVLVERNWLGDSGRIHGAGDNGPNPAAEMAFQIVGRHVGALTRDPR